jgi:hypothetical protein
MRIGISEFKNRPAIVINRARGHQVLSRADENYFCACQKLGKIDIVRILNSGVRIWRSGY